MNYVIDASFIGAMFLPDEGADRAVSFAGKLTRESAAAPVLWQLEVANLLLMAHRRKRIDSSQLVQLLEAVDLLPVVLQPALTIKQRGDLLHLANRHHMSAYDAAYLELAIRLSVPLATLDDSLAAAAKAEGVKLAL